VANTLGISSSNIIWDPNSQKVTIIDGQNVAQLTIGSTTMLLNGGPITMDIAPAISNGRIFLPMNWVDHELMGTALQQ
jgi:hypothetical protein